MIKIAIIGGSGYTGAELIRLLAGHPEAEVITATSVTYAGEQISALYPALKGIVDLVYEKPDIESVCASCEFIFTAMPHGGSMKIVPELIRSGKKVVDLGGDFRLKEPAAYEEWYGWQHSSPELLNKAVYGLSELNGDEIGEAALVANPGCYPTSVILGTAPALDKSLVFEQDIAIDSMSGITGAGRKADETTHFASCADNVSSYKTGGVHQHIPEMEAALGSIAGDEVKISFTPHLIPLARGIYSTIYADLKEDISAADAVEIYKIFYKGKDFVRVLEAGEMPDLKAVTGTNMCDIGVAVDERCGRLIVISAIDNLVKGAAGQAIQNMNIMYGLEETMGLTAYGMYP